MDHKRKLILILAPISLSFFIILCFLIYFFRNRASNPNPIDNESGFKIDEKENRESEDLIRFEGGEDLTVYDILEAPGEVIGKSSYGTLYRACLVRNNSVLLLRFLRPACALKLKEIVPLIQNLGSIRNPNLVPLRAFYAGQRGEKLLVHPFYLCGTLAEFIRDENSDCYKWDTIHKIALGIAKGLDHLHTGLQKPIIHGNLKSKNILLDRNYNPQISDFGTHFLLNPSAGQEMLETSSLQGYKAPELIKIKDMGEESDIYSFGVILLEIITGKEPINENPTPGEDFYLPNFVSNMILEHRALELCHLDIISRQSDDEIQVSEEKILKFFQLALSCCSPSPSFRPQIKQVVKKLEEIGM